MDEKQIHRIINNYEFIVNNCKCDILLARLRRKINITSDEYKELEGIKDSKTQCRQVLAFLINRGPNTFDALINALLESNQMTILQCLNPDALIAPNEESYQVNQQHSKIFQRPNYESAHTAVNVNAQSEPLDILVKLSSNFEHENRDISLGNPIYNTTSRNRGLVKIINVFKIPNMSERKGSDVDVKNLRKLFTEMGFTVDVSNCDQSAEDIIKDIYNFAKDTRLKDADMAILFVMSHGGVHSNGNEYIFGSDKLIVYLKDIERYFTNDECPHMQHKPKLIFYQTCRGDNPDYGVARRVETDSHVHNQIAIMPTHSDLIIAHSTCPNTQSHRDTMVGTWFIYLLCEVFMNQAHEKDIESMLKIVYHKLKYERSPVSNSMQTGEYTVRTFEKCYFNPGIYRGADNTVCFFNPVS